MPKKIKGRIFWDFFIYSVAKPQKIEGGPFGGKKLKEVAQCRKKLTGGRLVLPGIVCYSEKKEKPFWFSSLGQEVQFKVCRTFGRTILVTSVVSKKKH